MRYTVETVGGDELEVHETLTDAVRAAVSRLEGDPEVQALHIYEIGKSRPTGEHVKTVTFAPDAHWNSDVVVLDPNERIRPPSGAYLPRRITEEDLDGYELGDPKRISLERMIGGWV